MTTLFHHQRYPRVWTLVLALLGIFAWSLPAHAHSADDNYTVDTVHDNDGRVASKLIFSAVEVKPGDTFRVGVAFDIDPSWYIYWHNPDDAGIPTYIDWKAEDEIGRASCRERV